MCVMGPVTPRCRQRKGNNQRLMDVLGNMEASIHGPQWRITNLREHTGGRRKGVYRCTYVWSLAMSKQHD